MVLEYFDVYAICHKFELCMMIIDHMFSVQSTVILSCVRCLSFCMCFGANLAQLLHNQSIFQIQNGVGL